MAWRRAEIPAASGFGNARSVPLVQSVMGCGGTVRGVRLLSQAGCARMAVSYVTNQMREPGDDSRGLEVMMAAYDGLQGLRA